jgi:UDP-glucuronate decarboxylase
MNEDSRVIIICVDNNSTGRIEKVANLRGNPNFRFIEHDITEPLEISEKIDEIYNFACPASPPAYQGKNSIKTTKTSVIGAINMLELAKKHNAKILQASTSEIYGDPLEHPQKESYFGNVNPIGIRACYDEGKRCAESLFFDYHRHEGVKIKVVRIFNTYGPGMNPDDGRVISELIMQALRGEDIPVFGDGLQTRSFCYVDDLIEVMVRMMASRDGFTGPMNIGNPGEFTIMELAEKVIALTGSKSRIVFKDLPLDDPKKRRPDISLAKSELGWEPKIKLDEGLKSTIEYFKKFV